jgi:hypothetical protein
VENPILMQQFLVDFFCSSNLFKILYEDINSELLINNNNCGFRLGQKKFFVAGEGIL